MPIRPVALAVGLAAMMLTGPATAHDPIDIEPNFDPTIVWFDFPTQTFAARGRVRLVSANGQADAALDLEEYYFYQLQYREALAHLTMRMSLHRADPLARQRAFAETLRVYPDIQVNVRGATKSDIDESLRLFPLNLNFLPAL
ncbi:MAG: hypothetical protein AAGE03_13315 [Pseudomonadota bacterium]